MYTKINEFQVLFSVLYLSKDEDRYLIIDVIFKGKVVFFFFVIFVVFYLPWQMSINCCTTCLDTKYALSFVCSTRYVNGSNDGPKSKIRCRVPLFLLCLGPPMWLHSFEHPQVLSTLSTSLITFTTMASLRFEGSRSLPRVTHGNRYNDYLSTYLFEVFFSHLYY